MKVLDHITIHLKDLVQVVREMEQDGISTVSISILPPDELDGDSLPASISFEGSTAAEPNVGIDYDSIDSIE